MGRFWPLMCSDTTVVALNFKGLEESYCGFQYCSSTKKAAQNYLSHCFWEIMKSLANMPCGGNTDSKLSQFWGVTAWGNGCSQNICDWNVSIIFSHYQTFNLQDIYFILSKKIVYFSGVKNWTVQNLKDSAAWKILSWQHVFV